MDEHHLDIFQKTFAGLNRGVPLQQEDKATKMSLEMMINGAPRISFDLTTRLFRGRPLETKDTPFNTISEISARAPENVKDHQRCHSPGRSILYASNNLTTVLSELRAKEGQQIQVMEFESRVTLPVRSLWLGALDHYRRYGEFPHLMRSHSDVALQGIAEREKTISTDRSEYETVLDAFLSHVFRAEEPVGNSLSIYKLTSIVSEIFFDNVHELEAIIYPSVGHLGGWNVAIKPDLLDQKFDILSVAVHQVEKDLGYGLYRTKRLMQTTRVEEGVIQW